MSEPPPVKATISYQEPLVLQLPLQAPAFLGRGVTPSPGGTIGLNTYRPKSAGAFILPIVGGSEAPVLRLYRGVRGSTGWILLPGIDHGLVDCLVRLNYPGRPCVVCKARRVFQERQCYLCRRLCMVHLRCPSVVQISCQLLYGIAHFEYRPSMQGRRLEAQESRLPSEAPEGPSPSLVNKCITHPRFRRRG